MPQHVAAAVPEQLLEWDAEAALRGLRAPLLYVDAAQMADLDRIAEFVPTVAIARAAAVGHVQLIAHPRQAVAAIEDFRAAHGRPPVDNRAPVLALFDAVQNDELDRIDDLVAADFVDHGAPPDGAAWSRGLPNDLPPAQERAADRLHDARRRRRGRVGDGVGAVHAAGTWASSSASRRRTGSSRSRRCTATAWRTA